MEPDTTTHTEHDYRNAKRGFGWNLTYRPLPDNKLSATGWGFGIKYGDYMLLTNGLEDTRYQVSKISYCRDPPDMWNAILTFAPR